MEHPALITRLAAGALDETLIRLYGRPKLPAARSRCTGVLNNFAKTFSAMPEALFSAPGRTEIGGNHTDHQHGRVLAAAVDLDLLAAASPNHSGMVRIQSEGYPLIVVDLTELMPRGGEANTSAALIRGVAAQFAARGCALETAGLDAYIVSNVPGGSGLSSSAAFEVLIGVMMNEFFFSGACTPVEIARMGQYAENVFFGKPCGLMDQTASAVGGVVAIDFQDPSRPTVEQIGLDLHQAGYALCMLDSGAGHADLTAEYAAIPEEMGAVSAYFGQEVLRQVPEAAFWEQLPALRTAVGDRAVLRAIHFYEEDRRAAEEAQALRDGDIPRFLQLVRASGASSAQYLQNVVPKGQTTHQEMMVAIAAAERLLAGTGAVRIQGGGFGGAAQAFVSLERLEMFKTGMEAVLGKGSCHVLSVRPAGGVRLA